MPEQKGGVDMFGPTISFTMRGAEGKPVLIELSYPINEQEVAERSAKWLSNNRTRMFLFSLFPESVSGELDWLRGRNKSEKDISWFIYKDGKHVGGVGLNRVNTRDGNAEVGLLIGEQSEWGMGIAPAATAAVLDWGFNNILPGGLYKITVGAITDNKRSCAVLQRKVGFSSIGVSPQEKWIQGRWYDVWRGYMLASEWKEIRAAKMRELGIQSLNLYPGCEDIGIVAEEFG